MGALGPFALALLAGVVSFSSPCCLPLMPGYLSFVSSSSGQSSTSTAVITRSRTMAAAVLFVAGFALTFTLMGAAVSASGSVILAHREALTQVSGVFVITMGLASVGLLRIPFLFREMRPGLARVHPGPAGALPLGVAFAIGWTPCIGPVLTAIIAGAASSGGAWRGATLLLVYSLGLGIPFLLLALGYSRSLKVFSWLRRHGRGVEIVGGALLVLMGILMITGAWTRMFAPLLHWYSRVGWPPI